MTVTTRQAARPRRTVRRRLQAIGTGLGPYARPYRRHLVVAVVASVAVTAAQLALPWPLMGIVELTLPAQQRSVWLSGHLPSVGSPVLWLGGAFVLLGTGFGLSEHVQRLAVSRFVVLTVNDARVGIFARFVGHLSPENRARPGDVLTRLVVDTGRLRIGMRGVLVHLLQHGLFLAGVCTVLLLLDIRLGSVYLLGLLVAVAVAVVGTTRTARMANAHRSRESRHADEIIRATTEPGVELAARDPDRERGVAVVTQIKGRTACAVQGVLAVTACGVLIVAVSFADAGQLSRGEVALVASYLLMLHYPMMRMGRQITRLGPQITSAERLARLAKSSHPQDSRP